jgi:hypothetical protein
MITIFWTVYLGFTLFITASAIRQLLLEALTDDFFADYIMEVFLLTSTLWAIWYMYYLN